MPVSSVGAGAGPEENTGLRWLVGVEHAAPANTRTHSKGRITGSPFYHVRVPASLHPRLLALGVALSVAGWTGEAVAETRKEAATRYAKDALGTAEGMYLETRFDDALDMLGGAVVRCNKDTCERSVHARLYVLRAEVLVSGLKKPKKAEEALRDALALDPKLELDPEVDSKALFELFEKAKKKPKKRRKKRKKKKEPDAPPDIRRNWIRVIGMVDLTLLLAEDDLCAADGRNDRGWLCTRVDETVYRGVPTKGQQNAADTTMALSTVRVTAGYERLLGDNFTVGARLGFAFQPVKEGSSEEFLPLHAEARAAYWFGDRPFANVARPHLFLAGGYGPVITGLDLTVVEDGTACAATEPIAGDCTVPTDPERGVPEPRVQRLFGNKTAGPGFIALGFGLSLSPTPVMMIDLGVRVSAMIPVFTPVLSPELGMSFGF